MQDKLKIEFPSKGWQQFLTARMEMLNKYDRARTHARSSSVQTHHGRVAEAAFREWLASFLPKKFGVTPGYVVSPGLGKQHDTPHFDVIIYDQMNSPILWGESNSDNSPQGLSRAVPVEHVRAIVEVKSSFSVKTVEDSLRHLSELSPLLQETDPDDERYKLYLPKEFRCASVFFELRNHDARTDTALRRLVKGEEIRGYFGGLILRGEGHTLPKTARLSLALSEAPIRQLSWGDTPLFDYTVTESVSRAAGGYLSGHITWSESAFSQFAFDLLARMDGTYNPAFISSFYGLGETFPGSLRESETS